MGSNILLRMLEKSGKTLEDLPKNSNVGKLVRRHGVRDCAEFRRIQRLPRRIWETDPELPEICEMMTEQLKVPGSTIELRPVQAVVLKELHDLRGCMGVARVGAGKTIIAALAPVVLEAQRPLFLAPAKLIGKYNKSGRCVRHGKTEKEFAKLAQDLQVAQNYTFLSYEKLSNIKYYAGWLEAHQPDLIVLEEGHYVKNPRSNRAKVLRDYLASHPDVTVLLLTGTRSRNSVQDSSHVSEWCLGELSPLPRTYVALEEWALALDEEPDGERLAPGVLLELCDNPSTADLDAVQVAFGNRVNQTPGFVTVQSSDCDAMLSLEGEPFNQYDSDIDATFTNLRYSMATPDGIAFTEPIQLYNYLRQCQTGFHYYYDPPPPEPWKAARRDWGAFVREVLKQHPDDFMAEWQVAAAVARGKLHDDGLYARWKAIKPIYDMDACRKTHWFDLAPMRWCGDWLKEHKGIIFTPYIAVGEKIKEMFGVPYFGRKGIDKQAGLVDDYRGACVASLNACLEGRNLQHYSRALIIGGIGSASVFEQLLGRLHRQGQKADEVVYDVFYGCVEALEEIYKAEREAKWGKKTNRDEAHKLLVTDYLLPELEEVQRWRSDRWQKVA